MSSLLLYCHHHHHSCHCCHWVVVVTAIMIVIVTTIVVVVIATITAIIVTIATMFMVIALSLHYGHGWTMVGVAMSPLARSLEERGKLQREVINKNKKILACMLVHAWLRDSAMLASHHGCYCHWTMAGPWREGICTFVSKEGSKMGDCGEPLSEIANKKKKRCTLTSFASRSSTSYKALSCGSTHAKNPTLINIEAPAWGLKGEWQEHGMSWGNL
jgi:hypothetical protein